MLHIVVFNLALAATCLYAFVAGGQPEKTAALAMLVGCVATFFVPYAAATSFHSLNWVAFAIDLGLLAALVAIAMLANRFWPIWLAAVHLLAVMVHPAKLYDPHISSTIYALVVGKASYPMLLIIALGVLRHRQRVRRYGIDRDWSFGGKGWA